ncbi:Replication termination factor 2 [Spathaspora sp. JA1]|nr:Replication termination factor 2 [Spathaspora sp. JA1]
MGADGGTIAKRKDILTLHTSLDSKRSNHTNVGFDNELILLNSCGISALPLYTKSNDPIVGDYKGRLYLKEKILQYIIDSKQDKSKINPKFNHINSLKDLCDVIVAEWDKNTNGGPCIRCPITKISGGRCTYGYLRPCGCLMSYKAISDLNHKNSSQDKCPNCDTPFDNSCDVVIVNPLGKDEYNKVNQRSYEQLQKLHLSHSKKPLKKSKKEKNVSSTRKRSADSQPEIPSKRTKV